MCPNFQLVAEFVPVSHRGNWWGGFNLNGFNTPNNYSVSDSVPVRLVGCYFSPILISPLPTDWGPETTSLMPCPSSFRAQKTRNLWTTSSCFYGPRCFSGATPFAWLATQMQPAPKPWSSIVYGGQPLQQMCRNLWQPAWSASTTLPLTGLLHPLPIHPLPSGKQTAKIMLAKVFRIHGLLSDVVSDRGPQFCTHFWKEFCQLLGASVGLSSGFHPQSNGQTECINQELETCCHCSQNPHHGLCIYCGLNMHTTLLRHWLYAILRCLWVSAPPFPC